MEKYDSGETGSKPEGERGRARAACGVSPELAGTVLHHELVLRQDRAHGRGESAEADARACN